MAGQVEDGGEYPSSVPATIEHRVSDRCGLKLPGSKIGLVVYSWPSVFDESFDIT